MEFKQERDDEPYRQFPNTDFTVEYDSLLHYRLSIKLHGTYLKPVRGTVYSGCTLPPTDRLYGGSLETIKEDLDRLKAEEGGFDWATDR